MKKTTLLGLVTGFLLHLSVNAQYTITPVPPPPSFSFNDLWHFTVVRTQADVYKQFYVSLRIFDGTNTLKAKSNSAVFELAVGSRYFNAGNNADLQPYVTSYYDAGILQQAISAGGLFPPGTYHVAYTLFGKGADGIFAPLGEDAFEITVETMWPPMLLTPPDGDSLDNAYPLLTWTPAFTSTYTGPIDYTLNLVELFNGQNAYQAIQANPAYFSQNNIPVTMLPYPAGAQVLQIGKTYAWQVHARAGSTSLGSSEVWTFTLKTPATPAPIRLPNYYFKPAQKLAAEFVLLKEAFLPIALDERYQPAEGKDLPFVIMDENRKPLGTEKDFGAAVSAGFNRYLIPVCASEGKITLPKGKYYLEIQLEKKVRLSLAFEITETHCR